MVSNHQNCPQKKLHHDRVSNGGISECYIETTHIHPKAQGGYEKWIWWIWLKAQGGYEKSAPVDMAKARGGYENTLKVDMVDMSKSSGWI